MWKLGNLKTVYTTLVIISILFLLNEGRHRLQPSGYQFQLDFYYKLKKKKVTSPTKYDIFDFWSHGYIVTQDGNPRGEKIKIKIREIEKENRNKAMHFLRPWGQFPPGCMKLWVQSISWSQLIQGTMPHKAALILSGVLIYVCGYLSSDSYGQNHFHSDSRMKLLVMKLLWFLCWSTRAHSSFSSNSYELMI